MLLLLVGNAFASAYYNLDSGVRSQGRGGAFVVGADDLTAQYYNPAALMNLTHTTVMLDGWAINQYVRFDRADEPGDDGVSGTDDDLSFSPTYNESGWFPIPNAGVAFRLGGLSPVLDDTVVAVGMFTPTAPSLAFPAAGAQRYSLVDSLVWQIFYGLSVAQRFGPVTLGAGVNYNVLRVEQSLAVTTIPAGSDDAGYDVTLDISAWDLAQASWNAGIVVTPADWIQIGASVQPAIPYVGKGDMTATFAPGHSFLSQLDGDQFTDDDILLYVTTPWVLKAGVQVTPSSRFRLEGDFNYTTWGQLADLTVDPCAEADCSDRGMVLKLKEDNLLGVDDIEVTSDVAIPTGFKNAWSVRVGGDYDVADWLELRAGANYESTGVRAALQGVSVVDGDKIGLGLGGTFRFGGRWAVDVGASEQVMFGQQITDSELRQITMNATNPADPSVGTGKVIGNGELASRLTTVGVGVTVALGKLDATP